GMRGAAPRPLKEKSRRQDGMGPGGGGWGATAGLSNCPGPTYPQEPATSTAPHNRGCRVYSEDDTEPTRPRLARSTADFRRSPGRVECDGSRGPPRTPSRGGRPAD